MLDTLLDANLNRLCEGLRVLEDLCRFEVQLPGLTKKMKAFRHEARGKQEEWYSGSLSYRRTQQDPGPQISRETKLDAKTDLPQLLRANCKRIQEALRVIEEAEKTGGLRGSYWENFRFQMYTLEQELIESIPRLRVLDNWKGLYGLTAENLSKGRSTPEVVKAMLDGGIQILQYREKYKTKVEQAKEIEVLKNICSPYKAQLIINDHLDLALAFDCAGVHLGQEDIPLELARKILPAKMLIGVSTHSPAQALAAEAADYIGVGPIHATQTKEDVCAPVGLSYLEWVVKNLNQPFVAIGGIKLHNIDEILDRGAQMVAMVSEITGAPDIRERVMNSIEIIQRRKILC